MNGEVPDPDPLVPNLQNHLVQSHQGLQSLLDLLHGGELSGEEPGGGEQGGGVESDDHGGRDHQDQGPGGKQPGEETRSYCHFLLQSSSCCSIINHAVISFCLIHCQT